MPLEKRLFTTGLDMDSEERFVEPTSYRYALNVRSMSSDGDNMGAIENVKGNTLVTFQLPVGGNVVVGSYDYITYNKCYYFVYNALGSHSILEYNGSNNTITRVLTNSVLKFDPNYLITGINVVELDLNNHLLYWTDDNQEPRKINIEKGILHSQGNFTQGYSSPFEEHFIFRVKDPPPCMPECVYANDLNKNVNLLEGKLFQFKSAYIYDDYELTATSPISVVPFPVLVCGNSSIPTLNNHIQITVETGSSIVTRIKIYGREGNIGDFFEIADLDKSKLSIPNNSTWVYSFYNDKIYNTLEINQSIKLFDNVPLKSKAQEIIEGSRIADGNILEGYDPTPIDASLSMALQPAPVIQTFSFFGDIYIGNFFTNDVDYQYQQPIHDRTGTGNSPEFGGFGKTNIADAGSKFDQYIPLKGFLVYLAGTNYYAISQQTAPNVTLLAHNVFDSSSGQNHISDIRDAIENSSHNQVFSRFNFSGIPPGKYVMRIASHRTTQAELDANDLDWQRTSTNTMCVAGSFNAECLIDISTSGVITCGSIANTYAIGNGGQLLPSMIADLSNPRLTGGAQAITGYLTDKDIPAATLAANPSTEAYLADTRIELAKVHFKQTGSNSWNFPMLSANAAIGFSIGNTTDIAGLYQSGFTLTDHNGYFFITENFSITPGNPITISSATIGAYSISTSNLLQLEYATPTSTFVPPSGNQGKLGIFRSNDTTGNIEKYARTKLIGQVTFNGIGVVGVNVMTTFGGKDVTDIYGNFDLYVYVNSNIFGNRRYGNIIYGVSDNCIPTFNPTFQGEYYDINMAVSAVGGNPISPYNGTYNAATSTTQFVTLSSQSIVSILGGSSDPAFKRGSVIQFGIVYYNHSNRSSLTNTNDDKVILDTNNQNFATQKGLKLEIPFFTEINPNSTTNAVWGGSKPIISWAVRNRPPTWATHWQWVRTLNSVPNRYLQFTAKDVTYVDDNRLPIAPASATKVGINIQNILNYKSRYDDSLVKYVPEQGDRIRFIKDSGGAFFNSYIDLKIRDIDPAGIVYIDNISTLPSLSPGFLFEIYTPKLQSKSEIYYEFGNCFEVGNPGTNTRYHKGDTADQSPTNPSGVPATGDFSNGDAYWRIRNIPFGGSVPTSSSNTAPWYIEDASFSDFFSSKVQDIGRPNKVDDTFRQIRRKSTIYYSDKFIPETRINGLSSVFDTSFETYEAQYGGIQKLYNEDLRLDCYQELKVGAIPVNQVQFQSTDVAGASVVGSSDKVLNPIRYYQGEFGIALNPESFAQYGGARYFFDLNRGTALRLSNDGLSVISEYKTHNYFTDKSRDILSKGVRPNIFGVYDRKFNEYVISFAEFTYTVLIGNNIPTDVQFPGETIAFNEKSNAWSTFYSYLPENMCTSGVGIVTFKNGGLYTHNSNSVYNNFYGTQYSSDVWVICNGDPSKKKSLQALDTESKEIWPAIDILTPNGQSSNLISTDFEKKQNTWYAGVLRDVNSPNITNPLIEGDEMVDASFLIKLRNSMTSFVKLYAVNCFWQPQERSNR